MDSFELLVRQYEDASEDMLSDSLKIALVQKGIRDITLRDRLLLHAARLTSYTALRAEVRDIMTARSAVHAGVAPMDIGALASKGKGKGSKGGGRQGQKQGQG